MGDCCAVNKCPVDKSKVQFIIEKAKNFKAYLESYSPEDSVKVFIDGFDENMVLPTILTAVVPVVKAGKAGSAVLDLMKKLNVPDAEKDEVKTKLVRYMEMFAKVATS